MANNCWNRIEIRDLTDEGMKKIIEWSGNYKEFNYVNDWVNSLISKKNQLTPNFKEGGDPYAYGTKWFDFEPIDISDEENELVLQGDTAWSPLEGLCEAISKEFDCFVMIEFEESGCDFGGETHYKSGNKEEIFNGTYREYQYYCTGLEYMDSDTDCIDSLEEFEESKKEWLKIAPDRKEEVEKHFDKIKKRLTKTEKV